MNTLIKPPCTNGTAVDKQEIQHLSKANNVPIKPKHRYEVKYAVKNKLDSVSIIDHLSKTTATYADIVATVGIYDRTLTQSELNEYVAYLIKHVIDNSDEEDNIWSIIFDEVSTTGSVEREDLLTFGVCYAATEAYYYLMCDDYGREYDALDKKLLNSIFNDAAKIAMTKPLENRFDYITEHIEAGFY